MYSEGVAQVAEAEVMAWNLRNGKIYGWRIMIIRKMVRIFWRYALKTGANC